MARVPEYIDAANIPVNKVLQSFRSSQLAGHSCFLVIPVMFVGFPAAPVITVIPANPINHTYY